jgi:putative flippase GtrA
MNYRSKIKNIVHLHEEKFRFLVVGAINTLFGLSVFPILYFILGDFKEHYLILLSIAHFFALNFSFFTNKFYVFKTIGNYSHEYPRFLGYQILVLIAYMGPFTFLVEVGHLHPVVTQIVLSVTVVIISYFYYSKITFLKNRH